MPKPIFDSTGRPVSSPGPSLSVFFWTTVALGNWVGTQTMTVFGWLASSWENSIGDSWDSNPYRAINVNPGGAAQIVIIWYLNGIPPIKQPRGLLIQGWHYTIYQACMRTAKKANIFHHLSKWCFVYSNPPAQHPWIKLTQCSGRLISLSRSFLPHGRQFCDPAGSGQIIWENLPFGWRDRKKNTQVNWRHRPRWNQSHRIQRAQNRYVTGPSKNVNVQNHQCWPLYLGQRLETSEGPSLDHASSNPSTQVHSQNGDLCNELRFCLSPLQTATRTWLSSAGRQWPEGPMYAVHPVSTIRAKHHKNYTIDDWWLELGTWERTRGATLQIPGFIGKSLFQNNSAELPSNNLT